VHTAKLFVAAMGASSYTYAEAVASEGLEDWIGVHIRMFSYLGGVSKAVVPVNLKSAVIRPDRYDPGLNRTYAEMAEHYETAILPARAYKPKDKAKDLSVGSDGDAYDNALAECVIGLFKTEVINQIGPWKSVRNVEWETLKWPYGDASIAYRLTGRLA
jgi:hypothetical protein